MNYVNHCVIIRAIKVLLTQISWATDRIIQEFKTEIYKSKEIGETTVRILQMNHDDQILE